MNDIFSPSEGKGVGVLDLPADIVFMTISSNFLMGASFGVIGTMLIFLCYKKLGKASKPFKPYIFAFGVLMLSVSVISLMNILVLYFPYFRLSSSIKLIVSGISFSTSVLLYKNKEEILRWFGVR